MDAILSRVGEDDLRHHCVAAVLEELVQSELHVKSVVLALERTLKVVLASREVHKTLVLNTSGRVQTSFRRLGESCNQIGPLLRLLHHNMGARSSMTTDIIEAASAVPPKSTLVPTDSASTTTSEYEYISEEEDDEEPIVVRVAPPKKSNKRKADALELSETIPMITKETIKADTELFQAQLAKELRNIRESSVSKYTVAIHKDLSLFLKSIFDAADQFHKWQPCNDPIIAQLLKEMEKRLSIFKDSNAQKERKKIVSEWLDQMTALSFVSTFDLTSIPPKMDRKILRRRKNKTPQDMQVLAKCARRISSKVRSDASGPKEKKRKFFKPLLDAFIMYFAALAGTKSVANQTGEAIECLLCLPLLCQLTDSNEITRKECELLDELLYRVRFIMSLGKKIRKKAVKTNVVHDLLGMFPPSVRPRFNLPVVSDTRVQNVAKKTKKS